MSDQRIYDPLIEESERWIREFDKKGSDSIFDWNNRKVEEFKDVPVATLLEDDYFLGLKGKLYDGVKQDIVDLWTERKKREVNEACFLEAIGSGKSFKSSIIIWLLHYELCMFQPSPQEYFGMANDSIIAIMLLSRSEVQTRRVVFNYIWDRFKTPFNRDYFPVDSNYTRELRINRNRTCIYPGTSSAMSALGYNTYASVIDEINFLEVSEESKRSAGLVYDAATEMYNATMNRMTSRFMKDGRLPGVCVMISSPRYPDSFLERKIKEIESIGEHEMKAFVRSRALWEAKPKDFPDFYKRKEYFVVNKETLEIVKEKPPKGYKSKK